MKKFGFMDKLAYLSGDLANDFSFIFVAMYLMVFYTKVLGVSGAVVGTLFLTARIVDAFTDVGMGRILDNMKPRPEGKFRFWIKAVAPFVSFSLVLLFVWIVKDFPMPIKVAYIFVTYLFWGSICYTAINIPYGSMASVISEKAEDRAALSIFRSLGATIAIFIISYVVPKFAFETQMIEGKVVQVPIPQNFTIIALVFALCAFACYMFCYRFTIERVKIESKTEVEKKPLVKEVIALFSSLGKNKSLLIFIVIAIILLLSTMLGQGLSPYLYIDYFSNREFLAYHGMIGTVITIILATFTAGLVKVFGKQAIGAIGLIFAGIVYGVLTVLKLDNVKTFFVIYTVATIGIQLFQIIIWSFISDIIDDQEVREGKRKDGTIYAVYSFARKLGQALAGGLTGFALSAIGYVSSTDPTFVQSQSVKESIYVLFNGASAIGFLTCGLLLWFVYPLTKERVEANTAEIMKRRQENK